MSFSKIFYTVVFLLCLLSLLSGCYNKPVRHLASDAALLKVGVSTREDVLIYLGDPDEQQVGPDGSEKWLYTKKDMTLLERVPYAGKYFGSPEYSRLIVTLKNGIVTKCVYLRTDEDDLDWADDYSWQEKKSE
ncbi:hypothetical protein [Desulfomarina sp.]